MFWAQRANTCLSVTMPLRRLKICFQKKNIHGSPLVSRSERGGEGDLKQQFVQTSQFFLGRQSVTLGWTANLSKGLPTPPSTHNTSSFAVQLSYVEMTLIVGPKPSPTLCQQSPSFYLTLLLLLPPPPLRQVAAGLCQARPCVHHLRPLRQHRLRLSLKLGDPLCICSIQTRIPAKVEIFRSAYLQKVNLYVHKCSCDLL